MDEVRAAAGQRGLRQRKKARTRAAIREQALRLFGDLAQLEAGLPLRAPASGQ
jgi:hypothetical protein